MKKLISLRLRRALALPVLLCLGWMTTTAQSVYQDARRLAEIIGNQEVHVILEMDTTVLFWNCSDNILGAYNLEAPGDGLSIAVGECVNLKPQPRATLRLIHRQDTFFNGVITTETKIQNYAEGVVLTASGSNQERYFPKSDFADFYGILGAYGSDIGAAPPQKTSELNLYLQAYKDNPYMRSLLDIGNLPPVQDRPQLNTLVDTIGKVISLLQESPGIASLNLLRNDSIFSAEYLVSIQDIREQYRTPALSNEDALKDISTSIMSRPDTRGEGDITSILLAGLSDFIVERAQEEFNVAFMEKFSERLESVPELGVLFPQTAHFITQVDITNYKSVLNNARQFFVEDLNTIAFHLPDLLNLPKYQALANQPEVYNMITLYSLIDMSLRGVSIDSLLPYAYTKLISREQELSKSINLSIARDLSGSAAYQTLSDQTSQLTHTLQNIYKNIGNKQTRFYAAFPTLVLKSDSKPQQAALLKDLYLRAKTGLAEWSSRYKVDRDSITVIADYLKGQYNYDFLLDRANINQFDRFFDTAPDTVQLRGAGLALTRHITGQASSGLNKAQILLAWNHALSGYQKELESIRAAIEKDTSGWLARELMAIDTARANLRNRLLQDIPFWEQRGAVTHDSVAFLYLAAILANFDEIDLANPDPVARLSARRELVRAAEGKAQDLLARLRSDYPGSGLSPLELFFSPPRRIAKTDPMRQQLEKALSLSEDIRGGLQQIDSLNFGTLLKARKNAQVFSNILELTFRLLSCFIIEDGNQKWMSREQFNTLTADPLARNIFMGLVYQRVQASQLAPQLSPQGLASLSAGFVNILGNVTAQMDTLTLKREQKIAIGFRDYFPFVASVAGLLNQVLQTPLFVGADAKGIPYQRALVDFDSLARLQFIPQLSDNLLGLLDNVSSQQYRFAISNLVGLYETLALILDRGCENISKAECEQQQRLRHNLLTYGNFIADVSSAQSPEDVSAALRNVALPAGSSRIKRISPTDVTINGYFGGVFGRETLKGGDGKLLPVNTFGLSVPVGLSFSFKPSLRRDYSISVFLPVIDLGALTAYRIESGFEALPKLSFSNVLAPGAFAFFNFGKSPFYLGAGWQLGPQAREYESNGLILQESATRVLIAFGVDVPLFNLYRSEPR